MNSIEIINAWNALTAEEQLAFCRNCVRKAIKSGLKLMGGNDLEDAVQTTFADVLERLADLNNLEDACRKMESQGRTETLAHVICKCARATLHRGAYRAKKDSVIIDNLIPTADGGTLDLLDIIPGTDNTEEAATIRTTLKDFYSGLDSKDKTIFGGMAKGLSEREIAPTVKISNVAVHNRMAKIRARLAELL